MTIDQTSNRLAHSIETHLWFFINKYVGSGVQISEGKIYDKNPQTYVMG